MILNILFLFIFYFFFFLVKGIQYSILLLNKIGINFYKWYHQEKTILYIENFPFENAGYQYRSYKWKTILYEKGYEATVDTVYYEKKDFDNIYASKWNMNVFFVLSMYSKLLTTLKSFRFETVIVRRELLLFNDYGDLFYQKFLNRIHPNVVLDFDDDISASKNEPREIKSLYGKIMQESEQKFLDSLFLCKKFIVGSTYLKEMVLKYGNNRTENDICVIPTCVDYHKYYYKQYLNKEKIVLGWIGGIGNLGLLISLLPVLNEVSKKYPIKLLVISGKKITEPYDFEIENVQWDLNTEIDEVYKMDVGLMPIENDNISKGKCGFKLIQYMGLGIVSIASGVTVNNEIIENGVNSFTVAAKEDWQMVIENCLSQRAQFQEMGKKAKDSIHAKYTFQANVDKYVAFIQKSSNR